MNANRDRPAPGLTATAGGAVARVRSPDASQLWLCLFDGADGDESARLPLTRRDDGIWEGEFEGLRPGQVYGLRAEGPHAPARGHRFDPAKLLVDPYARRLVGGDRWAPALDERAYGLDSASVAPRGVLIDPSFEWRGDRPPATPWSRTLIYEAHVKGLTRLHPLVPAAERGTYLGLTHPAIVEHLRGLGVTALQLMPVQSSFTERHLVERGLTNYWGYNPVGWFAPHGAYAAGDDPVAEFKEMVRRLHAAGLEVLLDVVLNHTAEAGEGGPTLSLRGLGNARYYRLSTEDHSRYENYSGCGNTLDFGAPEVVEMALDCLRYWVEEMHVDGFRFDLGVTLGRGGGGGFSSAAPFFRAVRSEPALAGVKLIAEPWDLSPDGYRLGAFPAGWREWNDRFRDSVRAHWTGDADDEDELRRRLAGSSDLFPGRTDASINYVASHDGRTLADVVSYERRHNEANGEGNLDGHGGELCRNWGVEGPTDDPEILELRRRATRGMLAALALARGVPMLAQGDELGRTQFGNNNAYCQDNEVSWVDWSGERAGAISLWRFLLRLRRRLHGSG